MISAASSLQGQGSGSTTVLADTLPSDLPKSQTVSRRPTYAAQVAGYALNALVLLLYAYAGSIDMVIPAVFFLSGVSLIGLFALLSEAGVNEHFEDHHLAVFQVVAHVALQLGFLLAAPQIGYAFLAILFLIFGVAALRMTPRQAAMAWTLAAIGIALIFLRAGPPGIPVTTVAERLCAALCFIVPLGQCAFVGLYGDALRQKLYKRGIELSEAYERIEELAELDRADRSRLVQAYQRRLWTPHRRRSAQNLRHHHIRQHPQWGQVRPLRRGGISADTSGHVRGWRYALP
jgi:hypothetical protein